MTLYPLRHTGQVLFIPLSNPSLMLLLSSHPDISHQPPSPVLPIPLPGKGMSCEHYTLVAPQPTTTLVPTLQGHSILPLGRSSVSHKGPGLRTRGSWSGHRHRFRQLPSDTCQVREVPGTGSVCFQEGPSSVRVGSRLRLQSSSGQQ